MDNSAGLEPSNDLQEKFELLLKTEVIANKKTIFFQPNFYRAAAAVALLLIGGAIGLMINKQHDQKLQEITKKLEDQEKQNIEMQEMMAKLTNEQSASQRIQGVNVALKFDKAGDEIVNALVKTMSEDPNTNVRLAALDALSKFIDEPKVRTALINALQNQKEPHVQIALIQILVKIKATNVVNDLQKIIEDEGTIQAVKDEAYSGILRLS